MQDVVIYRLPMCSMTQQGPDALPEQRNTNNHYQAYLRQKNIQPRCATPGWRRIGSRTFGDRWRLARAAPASLASAGLPAPLRCQNQHGRNRRPRRILKLLKADPPRLSFKYDEILRRTQAICQGDSPVGSNVAQAPSALSQLVREAPVIEWDEDVLDIVEPYFLFFLRCSPFLEKLGQPK